MADDERDAACDAVLRYHYYVEHGINPAHIAPFREDWWANCLDMVPGEGSIDAAPGFYHQLLMESRDEMEEDYERAMKRAIVDYVLASPVQRQRLGLDALEPVMAQARFFADGWRDCVARALPEIWREDVAVAREGIAWGLQSLSTQALELNNLWILQGFGERLLNDVSSSDFTRQLPMDVESFRAHQVRNIFMFYKMKHRKERWGERRRRGACTGTSSIRRSSFLSSCSLPTNP
jgi:dynein heavy chain, axonemal